jgi:hypothetical protein
MRLVDWKERGPKDSEWFAFTARAFLCLKKEKTVHRAHMTILKATIARKEQKCFGFLQKKKNLEYIWVPL